MSKSDALMILDGENYGYSQFSEALSVAVDALKESCKSCPGQNPVNCEFCDLHDDDYDMGAEKMAMFVIVSHPELGSVCNLVKQFKEWNCR